jgi:hypothetical protein
MTDYMIEAVAWLERNAWALAIVAGGIIGVLVYA